MAALKTKESSQKHSMDESQMERSRELKVLDHHHHHNDQSHTVASKNIHLFNTQHMLASHDSAVAHDAYEGFNTNEKTVISSVNVTPELQCLELTNKNIETEKTMRGGH